MKKYEKRTIDKARVYKVVLIKAVIESILSLKIDFKNII